MKCVKLRALILVSVVAAQGSFSVTDVQAGPILDFLFGPRTTTYRPYTTTYRPYTASYGSAPTTAYYRGTSTAYYGGTSSAYYGDACCGAESYGTGYYSNASTYANAYTSDACDPCNPCAPQVCQPCQPTTTFPTTTVAPAPAVTAVPARPRILPHIRPQPRGFTGSNVGYLPSSSYRSRWVRVPVTMYRPANTVDPTTGAQVTAMRPCTTTQWQLQRVPVTTRRPFLSRLFGGRLFGRRTYQVPVTTPAYSYGYAASGSAAPAYGSSFGAGCTNCAPGSAITVPSTTISPSTSGGAVTTPAPNEQPADQPPSFDQLRARTRGASTPGESEADRQRVDPQLPPNRPNLDVKPVPDPDGARRPLKSIEPPPLLDPRGKTAAFPVRQAWAATPITWPVASEQKPATAAEPSNEIKWDSGGWTSFNN